MQRIADLWLRHSHRVRFQILSDAHLEVGRQYATYRIEPCAPYLILAGDIGRLIDYTEYLSFLGMHHAYFESIFLLLGNHEFYGLTHDEGLQKAKDLVSEPSLSGKVVLLHRDRVNIPKHNAIILGCTLWSHVPDNAALIVSAKINDYRQISGWDVPAQNHAHQGDLKWLRAQIHSIEGESSKSGNRIIIVTHHAPCTIGTSHPKDAGSPCSSAFATDLLGESWPGVKVWVFGHTHFSTDFIRKGVRIVANQRGYVLDVSQERETLKVQDKKHRFDPQKVVQI